MFERMGPAVPLLRQQAQNRAIAGTSHSPPFENHLVATWELLQFRAAAGQSLLVAAVGVSGESARTLQDENVLRATVSLALVDTARGTVERTESTRSFVTASIPDDSWVLMQGILPTSATGARLYRVSVTNPQRTAGSVMGGEVSLTGFHPDSLSLSDLVFAPLDGMPSFMRGEVSLSLAPGRQFRGSESAALYYEVYGLGEQSAYRTDIVISRRLDGLVAQVRSLLQGRPRALGLSYQDIAVNTDAVLGVQAMREIGLSGLEPGAYDLKLTITDEMGRHVSKKRTIWIAED